MKFLKRINAISIDIETMNLDADEISLESKFLKGHPNTKDADKIKAQIQKKKEDLKIKGAVKDSCKISCIGLHMHGQAPVVIHTIGEQYNLLEDYGIESYFVASEQEMLEEFRAIMDNICDDETEIVVAGKYFDIPKLRLAAVRNGVKSPKSIIPMAGNRIYDVLYVGGKYFLVGNKRHNDLGLDELCERLGVETGGKVICGSEVPRMIEDGECKEVVIYNALDAVKNTECYRKMTCQ